MSAKLNIPALKLPNLVKTENHLRNLVIRPSYNIGLTRYETVIPIIDSTKKTIGIDSLFMLSYMIYAINKAAKATNANDEVRSNGILAASPSRICNKNKTTKETTAAIIWFSVNDEIKSPTDINAAPNSIYPIYAPAVSAKGTVPNTDKIAGNIRVIAIAIRNRHTADKYLPMTIWFIDRGEVYRS